MPDGMAHDQVPDKRLLMPELRQLALIGYRVGRAERISQVELLVRLRIAGGPGLPSGTMGWHKRRESIRSLLASIADCEVRKVLDEKYAEATRTLFRLDKPRPLETQSNLNDLQAELSEFFGETDERGFLNHHRKMLFEVIAEALIQREEEAMRSDDLEEPPDREEAPPVTQLGDEAMSTTADGKMEDDGENEEAAPPPEPTEAEVEEEPDERPPAAPPVRASAGDLAPEGRASRPRPFSWTASALIGVVLSIAVAALILLVLRSQSSDSGQSKSETTRQAQTSPRTAASAPAKDTSTAPAVPPTDFTAEVVNWCYCADSETLESQIKLKPHFVNHAARKVDLRTGGSARLGLAFYAKSSTDRSWITPTEPRYRRYGKWLVVPPNAPGDLTSPTMFETHWEPASLRPFGEYLDPDFYEGDLVFNVPPSLSVGGNRVRLAYRLRSGDLYFPRKGAARQWRGYRREGNTF